MGLYKYLAAAQGEPPQEMLIEADSPKEALDKLRSRRVLPVRFYGEVSVGGERFSLHRSKINTYEFTRQLAPLLESFIPLEKALGIALFTEKVDKTQDPVYQAGEDGLRIPVWPTITTFNSATWNNVVNALNGLTGYAFDLKIVTTNSKGETEEIVLQISVDKSTIGAQANSIELDNESLIF